LKAGLGFGGYCLPKDIQAFIKLADRAGVDFGLLKEAERVNKQRVDRLMEKVKNPILRLWYARKTIEHGWSRAVLTPSKNAASSDSRIPGSRAALNSHLRSWSRTVFLLMQPYLNRSGRVIPRLLSSL